MPRPYIYIVGNIKLANVKRHKYIYIYIVGIRAVADHPPTHDIPVTNRR